MLYLKVFLVVSSILNNSAHLASVEGVDTVWPPWWSLQKRSFLLAASEPYRKTQSTGVRKDIKLSEIHQSCDTDGQVVAHDWLLKKIDETWLRRVAVWLTSHGKGGCWGSVNLKVTFNTFYLMPKCNWTLFVIMYESNQNITSRFFVLMSGIYFIRKYMSLFLPFSFPSSLLPSFPSSLPPFLPPSLPSFPSLSRSLFPSLPPFLPFSLLSSLPSFFPSRLLSLSIYRMAFWPWVICKSI